MGKPVLTCIWTIIVGMKSDGIPSHGSKHVKTLAISTTLSSAYQYFLAKTLETNKMAKKYMTWKRICWLGGDRIWQTLDFTGKHLQGWGHSSVTDTLEYVTMLRGEYIYIHTVKLIHNTRNTNFLFDWQHLHSNDFAGWHQFTASLWARKKLIFRHECVRHVLQPFTPQTMWLPPKQNFFYHQSLR